MIDKSANPPVDEVDIACVFNVCGPDAEYGDGVAAWCKFLKENLDYPEDAVKKNIQGKVIVDFCVSTTGFVSDIKAICGPEELRAAAVAVIKKSGKWTPAIQNGRYVKSDKRQPITFKLEN